MSHPLLTIIIPTYNRANNLSLLLRTLATELYGLGGKVDIIIGDNASSDNTASVISTFLESVPTAKILRHSSNIGPEENFCRCIDISNTRFLWILGDDDLPKSGVISQILKYLSAANPDLLYLKSQWLSRIHSSEDGSQVQLFDVKEVSRENFAQQVNVWVTFISGMIVNFDRLDELIADHNIRKYTNTSLVQLGWVLPMLLQGNKFAITSDPVLLGTSGNSEGYKFLTVFGKNLPNILDEACGMKSPIKKIIKRALIWGYLPDVVWFTRVGKHKNFISENPLEALSDLKNTIPYWIIYLPFLKLPLLVSYLFRVVYKLLKKLILFINQTASYSFIKVKNSS